MIRKTQIKILIFLTGFACLIPFFTIAQISKSEKKELNENQKGKFKKDGKNFSSKPVISILDITDQKILGFSDSLTIRIRYFDGDGDLGENKGDLKNLFVKDSRGELVYAYRIRQLAPDNFNKAITGELKIVLDEVPISTDSLENEKVHYRIWLFDRAGNKSNELISPEVTVLRKP